jgi:hypothetical protein
MSRENTEGLPLGLKLRFIPKDPEHGVILTKMKEAISDWALMVTTLIAMMTTMRLLMMLSLLSLLP